MAAVQTGFKSDDIRMFQADTEADVTDLPTDVGIGSECIVISTGNIYLLNSEREWQKLGGDS